MLDEVYNRSQGLKDREQQLDAALSRLFDRTDALKTALNDAAQAESNYRIAYSEAFLNADGTGEQRKATAIIAVKHLLKERDRTAAVKEFTIEYVRGAQKEVSARQSQLAAETRTNKTFA